MPNKANLELCMKILCSATFYGILWLHLVMFFLQVAILPTRPKTGFRLFLTVTIPFTLKPVIAVKIASAFSLFGGFAPNFHFTILDSPNNLSTSALQYRKARIFIARQRGSWVPRILRLHSNCICSVGSFHDVDYSPLTDNLIETVLRFISRNFGLV